MAQALPSRPVHVRHLSKEFEDLPQTPHADAKAKQPPIHISPPRQRVQSSPANYLPQPPAAPLDAYRNTHASSPFRSSFSFNASSPSSTAFPSQDPVIPEIPSPTTRRHSRIHSRNLSVYFPRPGAPAPIAEDSGPIPEAPETLISSPPSKGLREGFKFGGQSTNPTAALLPITPNSAGATGPSTRKGHHHKHSLSHNFFSFLDPTAAPPPISTTLPPSVPNSPWTPVSPFPATATTSSFPKSIHESIPPQPITSSSSLPIPSTQTADSMLGKLMALPTSMRHALLFALVQFGIGATMWVSGQQNGSLGCTGLGYWVVFDAAGVALGVFGKLIRLAQRSTVQQPFGSQRIETVALFAQAVYLIFSSVYVCKETIEHVLLEAGSSHHHHRTDEFEQQSVGITYPTNIIWLSLLLIGSSSLFFNNHFKLVDATGNHVPSLYSLIRSARYSSKTIAPIPTLSLLSNPFTLAPIIFSAILLGTSYFVSPDQQRPADLFLAGLETVVTFMVAYPAALALGQVLLQTAPERGLPGGQMEAFLRAMREIERNPQVLHLPAPHIWQLSPPAHSQASLPPMRKDKSGGDLSSASLVVTIELHVRKDLEDAKVIELTRWAHDRCANALGQGGEGVTVGIVRG